MKRASRRQRRAGRMESWVQTALAGALQQERKKCGQSWRKLRPECQANAVGNRNLLWRYNWPNPSFSCHVFFRQSVGKGL